MRTSTTTTSLALVREAYPLLKEMAYFNTGTYGLMAEPVLECYLADLTRFERGGMAGDGPLQQTIEQARQRIAQLINATYEEIAFSGNATDGVNFIAAGIDWHPGDEIIISDQEHPAMLYPWHYTAQRHSLVIKHFTVSPQPEESIASIRSLLTPRTRLIGTSHVTSPTGTRLPVKAICNLAHAHGALALVDGAQSFGVIPIDVRDCDCDFFTSNLHKWVGGPKGTGFLFVRTALMNQLSTAYVGAGAIARYTPEKITLQPDGHRFEFGTRNFAATAAIKYALDWFDTLGWSAISHRIAQLTSHLKAGLASLSGVDICTPTAWEHSSGLVTFRIPGRDETQLQELLQTQHLFPRTLGKGSEKIRVSCALFNSEEELDQLIACVKSFLGEQAPSVHTVPLNNH